MAPKSRSIESSVGMANKDLPAFIWLPVVLFAIAASLFVVIERVAVQDWVFFNGYTAPERIVEISNAAMFTSEGVRLFERTAPEFVSVSEVAEVCPGADNLGCLVTGPKIYLVDFEGESDREQSELIVTAAHEMLHLAYSRLSEAERESVDILVAQDVTRPGNESVAASIERYTDDIERADEAHSILATEGETVSGDLARHYAQYFNNRGVIVDFYRASR